ncbi:hypothetical protein PYW08_002081 [Mythimna loreyi]|uniref:Uncharacterized protein n=1 Tax=Mythimna loreyi TaxID=667449 RepID=A0ACC2R530_9NEOP|nr:hypothetical protein PYW08_002081 [Mythimna loreyi]
MSDIYLRRLWLTHLSHQRWAVYKNAVPVPSMVDNFHKQYEALMEPYPTDTQIAQTHTHTHDEQIGYVNPDKPAHSGH